MNQFSVVSCLSAYFTSLRKKYWKYTWAMPIGHTSYLSPRSPTCRWRRNLPCGEISDFNTWNFSTWRGISVFPHNRCGEMWIFAKFGEISHFSTGQMWRNLKFIQFFVIKSVLRCFCEICFGAIYALLRGEIFCKKMGRWRKNDKCEVWCQWPLQHTVLQGMSSPQCGLHMIYLSSSWGLRVLHQVPKYAPNPPDSASTGHDHHHW